MLLPILLIFLHFFVEGETAEGEGRGLLGRECGLKKFCEKCCQLKFFVYFCKLKFSRMTEKCIYSINY